MTSCQFPTGSLSGRKGQRLKKIRDNLQMCKEKPQHVQKQPPNLQTTKYDVKNSTKSNDGLSTLGTVNIDHALCVLSLNIVNDKIFLIEW